MSEQTSDGNGEFLVETEAAQLLRLSVRTLQAWRVDGAGPPYVKMGRAVRYQRSALLVWADSRAVPTDGREGLSLVTRGGADA